MKRALYLRILPSSTKRKQYIIIIVHCLKTPQTETEPYLIYKALATDEKDWIYTRAYASNTLVIRSGIPVR